MLWTHRGYAGDLSVEQIEEEHSFKFTNEEKEYLKTLIAQRMILEMESLDGICSIIQSVLCFQIIELAVKL